MTELCRELQDESDSLTVKNALINAGINDKTEALPEKENTVLKFEHGAFFLSTKQKTEQNCSAFCFGVYYEKIILWSV